MSIRSSRRKITERRALLLWLTGYVRDQLLSILGVLGIEQPPYM